MTYLLGSCEARMTLTVHLQQFCVGEVTVPLSIILKFRRDHIWGQWWWFRENLDQ